MIYTTDYWIADEQYFVAEGETLDITMIRDFSGAGTQCLDAGKSGLLNRLTMICRCTVIYSGYIIPGYFSELSFMKYTAQFKNLTTARMH